ncbi:MAG TPA: HDIG domain-containing protein [Spirochaetia bacterium]|nr:HDIG domain-containing protein [Spirochaetales bacterium]HRS64531.1 HDIG domain-containing protein [Spirochaetia bacterium]HOT59319.1 HDIG domain-containing protein [Spirochaetales bacterium]HPD79997.1 HDIG domain-containing protein [Spirochaetales bacterium]HQK34881.1 HDIG domain-containing protein [Spirochaetales bacterium]
MNLNHIKKQSQAPSETIHAVITLYSMKLTRRQFIYALLAFLICSLTMVLTRLIPEVNINSGIEVGKVADRDIVANEDIIYIDQEATQRLIMQEKNKAAPIFVIDDRVTQKIMQNFQKFKEQTLLLLRDKLPQEEVIVALEKQFGTRVSRETVQKLTSFPAPAAVLAETEKILIKVLEKGIVAFPDSGLEEFNSQIIELQYWKNSTLHYEQIAIDNVYTITTLNRAIQTAIKTSGINSSAIANLVAALSTAFIEENAFFDAQKSQKRLQSIETSTEPVLRQITKGEKIIRKGFIITDRDTEEYKALQIHSMRFNIPLILGTSLIIAIFFFGILFLLKSNFTGFELPGNYWFFVLYTATVYFIIVNLLFTIVPETRQTLIPVFLPGALITMVMTILINERFSLLFSIFIAVLYLIASNFDGIGTIAVLLSGLISTNFAMRTEQRIDLIRSALQIAAYQFGIGFVISMLRETYITNFFLNGLWFGINGFLCGTLTLGFLPILEHWFNAPTVFRLQELSDLNNPILKRLLTLAPGTYAHSVTVAHLAESACLAIGASPILARVGSYYHDLGKMEQPEYFIENQAGYNKHNEIKPNLSATILKSHVQFGIERARELGLPEVIIDIISQHHGTSLMHYFFNEMKKIDPNAEPNQFRYSGPLPQSKEAAVVMLADSVEAASRVIKKPNIQKLEQMIDEVVKGKIEEDQFSACNLTFKDIELIENAFVRVLAGHFHSRIEYPKIQLENSKPMEEK